jgi:hypothetical protein
LSICADVKFFENYHPEPAGWFAQRQRWSTYEVQHGWLRGVGLGFGARYYTRQSGDLLDTFSIAAYDLTDAAIFIAGGIWVGR